MPAEATQEQGRRGVALVKRWLEATTYVELPWNAYENPSWCEIDLLGGGVKRFDLAGYFLTGDRQPVVVENKSYNSDGGQYTQFQEFLAHAYSSTAHIAERRTDAGREFIWVTSHPFGPLNHWSKLESAEEIRIALQVKPEVLDGRNIDEEMLRTVANRIWVLVMNKKQGSLSLTPRELGLVHVALKRKEPTL